MITRWNNKEGRLETRARRRELDLVGMVPPQVLTQDQQAARAYQQYQAQPTDLAKNVYLTALHDRNQVLFFRLLGDHLAEMLPIVYTPTVGAAIERYSYVYRPPPGSTCLSTHPMTSNARSRPQGSARTT